MISVLIATFSITDDSSIKKRRRPCRQKIHNIITYAQLGIHFTWTNDAVNPFKCIICSVSTKFATYPSESAPLLHIRVPSKKCKLFSTRLTKTFFFNFWWTSCARTALDKYNLYIPSFSIHISLLDIHIL